MLGSDNNGERNQGDDPRERQTAEALNFASRNAFPLVSQTNGKSDVLGLIAGALIVLGLGWIVFLSTQPEQQIESPPVVENSFSSAEVLEDEPNAGVPDIRPVPIASPLPIDESLSQPQTATRPNPYSTPTLVFDTSSSNSSISVPPVDAAPPSEVSLASTGNSASDFASRIGGVGGAPAQARPMSNPATTITQGTLIPAILETAIDTDVPGFVRAVVSEDVYSFDGTSVLVPRSSRLVGQYQSGLQAGQRRAFVIWTRVIRPDGVSVNLASPGVAFDGTTGLAGDVKSNFFRRFGSALLLSVVDGLAAVASGGASVVLGGGSSAAAAAIEQDGQIGPTIRVRQGEPIRVFTSRDLDFSQVTN